MKLDLDGTLRFSPTDLNAHLGCAHATTLALQVARRIRPSVKMNGAYQQLIVDKGMKHEAAYLKRMIDEHREIARIHEPHRDYGAAAARTVQAMRDGAELIYQAAFVYDGWRGLADFVERVPGETDLGDYGYEAVDTKLARTELMPHHAMQLCFYSEGIARVQGAQPVEMHVELGSGVRETVQRREVAAYFRRARAGFEGWTGAAPVTEAYPCEQCRFCDFARVCIDDWRAHDHLRYVANIRRTQVSLLRAGSVHTLTALAGLDSSAVVPQLTRASLDSLHDQAHLQRRAVDEGVVPFVLEPLEPLRGFARLPKPSPGDVMFDLEGDPFWEADRGLTFLFGLLLRDGDDWHYEPIWAHDDEDEKRAFERVVDRLVQRRERHPDMHVYVYSHAEATGLRQLIAKHATREDEVDELLRGQVLVDLLQVVRQGLRAGLEGYSLKQVECLAGFVRRAGMESGAGAVVEYERWRLSGDARELGHISDYNEDDCRATLAVRDWLVAIRPPEAEWFTIARSAPPDEDAQATLDARAALRAELVRSEPGSARWLAGELLSYHRREARPDWWMYFARFDMNAGELLADAEAVGGLELDGEATVDPVRRSLGYWLTYPAQEHKLSPGTWRDQRTRQAVTVEVVDDLTGRLQICRAPSRASEQFPEALVPDQPIPTPHQRAALFQLAEAVRDGAPRFRALQGVLARELPRFVGREAGTAVQTVDLDEQKRLALTLDESCLVVQGPPGTGKTYTGARLIVHLIAAGKRVGVTALSHNAIDNLLREVERAAGEAGVRFTGARYGGEFSGAFVTTLAKKEDCFADEIDLVAGTTWLFAPEREAKLDVLVIDEAGQLSLADALAAGTAARNLILLGDPQQLPQVSKGTHPEGAALSVLEHLLAGEATIPRTRGVFLERTWRMHPDVCGVISREVYDGRLLSHPDCAVQATTAGTGIRYLPVEHTGNGSRALAEAACIADEVARLLDGATWTDMGGVTRILGPQDIMVVSPYNAQVRTLRGLLPGVRIGTVDRFQGQEAPVVFYSLAVSTAADAPRGLEFLLSRNRVNVAISRARCLAYLVCAPALLEAPVRTLDQMRLVSTFCRLVEAAPAG